MREGAIRRYCQCGYTLAEVLVALFVLAVGIIVVVEGPGIIRPLTASLPQPFRSLALLASLDIPLVVLSWCGKRLLGYNISHTTRSREKS